MNECIHDVFVFNNLIRAQKDFDDYYLKAGKSFYEVLRLIDGCCLFLEDHFERLENSLRIFSIDYKIDYEHITNNISELISNNNIIHGNIKLIINFNEIRKKKPDVLVYFVRHKYPSSAQYRHGIDASLLTMERIMPNAKYINDDAITDANRELPDRNIYETLLVNEEGLLTEGSKSNVFFIKDDTIFTSPVEKVLPGITRKYVICICNEQNIRLIEQDISISDLNKYSTVFLSGTSAKILPVKRINDLFFQVNNNILKKIMKTYNKKIIEYCSDKNKKKQEITSSGYS